MFSAQAIRFCRVSSDMGEKPWEGKKRSKRSWMDTTFFAVFSQLSTEAEWCINKKSPGFRLSPPMRMRSSRTRYPKDPTV